MATTSEKLGQILANTTKGILSTPSAPSGVGGDSKDSSTYNGQADSVSKENNSNTSGEKKSSNLFTIIIIGLVLVAAILFIFYIWRKRKASSSSSSSSASPVSSPESATPASLLKPSISSGKNQPSQEMIEKMRAGLMQSLHSNNKDNKDDKDDGGDDEDKDDLTEKKK